MAELDGVSDQPAEQHTNDHCVIAVLWKTLSQGFLTRKTLSLFSFLLVLLI